MMANGKLKKWEIALLLSVCITLGYSLFFGGTPCGAWWGTIYPELTEPAGSAAVFFAGDAAEGTEVELRFRFLEWLEARLSALAQG